MLNININRGLDLSNKVMFMSLVLLFCSVFAWQGESYSAISNASNDTVEASTANNSSNSSVDQPNDEEVVTTSSDIVDIPNDEDVETTSSDSTDKTVEQTESIVATSLSTILPVTDSPPTIEIVPLGNTGAASTRIPIAVPPGRKGISPDLSLTYSSSRTANGWVGFGWSLDMGDIRKSGKADIDYVYTFNGFPTELVARSDWNGCYGAKIERDFTKYCYDSVNDKWEVTKRNGIKYYYGRSSNSRLNDDKGTFKWSLDKVLDLNGNYMETSYWKDPADPDNSDLYLDRIDYTGAADLDPTNYIIFNRESRTDVTTLYTIGSKVISAYLLNQIDVFAGDELVRSYELNYTPSPHSDRSLLSSMTMYGSDGISAMPSITFQYQTSDDLFEYASSVSIASDDYPKTAGDFNGDGRTDFFTCKGRGLYSNGTTFYEAFNAWTGLDCNYHTVISGDFNGDGMDDIIVYDIGATFPDIDLFLSIGEDFVYTSTSFSSEEAVASGDFNGDGKDDFVSASGMIFYSDGSEFLYGGNQGLFGTEEVFSGDFNSNNDGKDEVLLDDSGTSAHLYISTGNDFELLTVVSANPIAAGDFNGDGTVDFIDANKNIHFSNGAGFADSDASNGLPAYTNNMLGGDFNGDGKSDVLILNPTTDEAELYISTGATPDLLYAIDNGLGGVTTISYKPSTFYNNTYLPFVSQTVEEVTINDGNGNSSTTKYDYSGGYYDESAREFRGFAFVETTAPNGSITEVWYEQDDIFKGLAYETVITDSAGNLYTIIDNVYESSVQDQNITVPYLSQRDSLIYDGFSDPKKSSVSFTYDSYGNITNKYHHGDTDITGDEREEVIIYDPYDTDNWLISLPKAMYIKDENNAEVARESFTYYLNTSNLWTKTSWYDGGVDPVTTYTYDSYGNIETTIDPEQYLKPEPDRLPITITYDDATHTYPERVENQMHHTIDKTFDYRFGGILTEKDVNGNTTRYQYDVFGRIKKVVNPNDTASVYGTTTYYYLDFGSIGSQRVLTHMTEKSGTGNYIWSEKYFDGLGRAIQTRKEGSDNKVIVIDTIYNDNGLLDSKSLPYFEEIESPRYTTYDYDPVGRVIKINYPDNSFEKLSYMKDFLAHIDANGHKKIQVNDAYGRIVEIQEYVGKDPNFSLYASTKYKYDVLGNLTDVWDDYNSHTYIEYDSLSRKKTMDDPDMGYWQYDYDLNGNVTSQIDAKLQEVNFEYDDVNRIKRKIYVGSTDPDVLYDYDEYEDGASTNAVGRLTKITEKTGSTEYHYDKLGNTIKIIKSVDGTDYITETTYDALGRTDTLTYPDDTLIKYQYGAGGNLSQITNEAGNYNYAIYSGYNALGQYEQITFGNGVTTSYQYRQDNSRLYSIVTDSPSSGELINLTYDYDSVGNIKQISDTSNDLLGRSKTRSYEYDDLNRLIEAKSDSYGGALLYQYDKIGNITYNCRYGYYEYDYDNKPHAVRKIMKNSIIIADFSYDDNGNMEREMHFDNVGSEIPELGRDFTYDYDNMPTSIAMTGAATISNYDASGQRVKKAVPGATTTYIGPTYECTNGVCTKYVFNGIQMIAKIESADTYYYHTDHLGSSTVITDDNADKAEEAYYYPYGELMDYDVLNTTSYTYTGKEYDAETGLYYYGARYYDPKLARFISADTIVPMPFNPQTLNRYAYGYNNPIMMRDLDGHYAVDAGDFSGGEVSIDTVINMTQDGTITFNGGGNVGNNGAGGGGGGESSPLPAPTPTPDMAVFTPALTYSVLVQIGAGEVSFSPAAHVNGYQFSSPDDAAIKAIDDVMPNTVKANIEYGGFIYFMNNEYSYTDPVPGTENSLNVSEFNSPPKGADIVAVYHTHPGDSYVVPYFSTFDYMIANEYGSIYLGTESGLVKAWNPATDGRVIREPFGN